MTFQKPACRGKPSEPVVAAPVKICLLGAFAVGKTSLVQRRVEGNFDEDYETTVGVRIDHARIDCTHVVLWDLPAEDRFQSLVPSHLRRTSGLLLVADVTRGTTIPAALKLEVQAQRVVGSIPTVLVLNKIDRGSRDVDLATLRGLPERGVDILETSARTGQGVEEAFARIVQKVQARSLKGLSGTRSENH